MGPQGGKNYIIMHVWARKSQKVHYNAVFGMGKKALNAETQSAQRKDFGEIREESHGAKSTTRQKYQAKAATLKGSSTDSKHLLSPLFANTSMTDPL
jgi:hypothetical protein